MDEKPVVPLVIAAIICPICMLSILAPAFLGSALTWVFAWFGGFDPVAATGLAVIFAILVAPTGSKPPYQPIFVIFTLGFLGAGFWMVYRRPQATMPEGSYCPRSISGPWIKVALWASTILILAAIAFPYAAPLILDV